MNKYIKVHIISDRIPPDNYQVYRTTLPVKIGDTVQCSERSRGVVLGFTTIDRIPRPERVPEIVGRITKDGDVNA